MADSSFSSGDLTLSVKTLSNDVLKILDAVISRLDLIENKFSSIGKATNNVGKSKNGGKNSDIKARKSGITDLTYQVGIFGKKYVSAMTRVSKYNGKTITEFNKWGQVISRTNVKLDRFGRNITTIFNAKQNNSGGGLLNIAKWSSVIYLGKKLGGIVYKIAQSGADFQETLNMWSVSMGKDLLPQATAFVDKMNEAYGVSKKTLMQAQATYKNMLGSLGQISEQQAYILSEGVTQMALDYASLYNQTFDQATTKFQAALAGQVRPIRSVAGYDITENTLFEIYKSLGGEKSMRQLTRTEKQLLSIYAIFQQMERSGATGDLAATMESFANQSRVAKERMQDILSYSGMLITHFLETTGVMKTLNGVLIFMADVLEAVVNSVGAAKNFERDDPFAGLTDGANGASDAVDELNGKLLGFDKFRSLNESESGGVGIDSKLIEGLSKYKSILADAKMEATEIAEQLKKATGLFDKNGAFNLEKWQDFKGILEAVGIAFGVIFGVKMLQNVTSFFVNMVNWFSKTNITILLFATALGFIVASIKAFSDGDITNGLYLVAGAITAIGVALFVAIGWLPAVITLAIAGVVALTALIIDNWEVIKEFTMKLINTIANGFIWVVNKVIDGLNLLLGWAGVDIGKWEASVNWGEVGTFADGGLPDKGSMFIAGEAGAEYVYNMPNGQSGVANVQQIAQATYQGTMSALRDWWGGTGAKGDIPQLREASATGMYQAVTGVAKSYGERWDKY